MKRCLLILGLFLLLVAGGAIVNVAVAWGCSFYYSSRTPGGTQMEPGMHSWPRAVSNNWPESCEVSKATPSMIGMRVYGAQAGGGGVEAFTQTIMQCGLPVPSLEAQLFFRSATFPGRYSRFALSAPAWMVTKRGYYLPLLPIWPGFAINTLFYAALLWLPVWGVAVLHRKRRLRRGVCPGCAYPVGVSPVCTECGKPLSIRKT